MSETTEARTAVLGSLLLSAVRPGTEAIVRRAIGWARDLDRFGVAGWSSVGNERAAERSLVRAVVAHGDGAKARDAGARRAGSAAITQRGADIFPNFTRTRLSSGLTHGQS